MRKFVLLVAVAAMLLLALVGSASGHPDEGEVYVPWMDKVSADRVTRSFLGV